MLKIFSYLRNKLRIGHKILFFGITTVLFSGCWSEDYDYFFKVFVKNETKDTLTLVFGKPAEDYPADTINILPHDAINYKGLGYDIDCEELYNIQKIIFEGGFRPFEEQLRVLINDSLKITWEGPGREIPENIHHFYNLNSWEYWLIDENEGIIQFTIYESDLTGD